MEENVYVFALGLTDAGKFQTVKTYRLQIRQIQSPSEVNKQVVQSHPLCVKKALVIRIYAYFDTLCKKSPRRMVPQVVAIAKYMIAHRTTLNANVLLLH